MMRTLIFDLTKNWNGLREALSEKYTPFYDQLQSLSVTQTASQDAREDLLLSIIDSCAKLSLDKETRENIDSVLIASVAANYHDLPYLKIIPTEDNSYRFQFHGIVDESFTDRQKKILTFFANMPGAALAEFHHVNPVDVTLLLVTLLDNPGCCSLAFVGQCFDEARFDAFTMTISNHRRIQCLDFDLKADDLTRLAISRCSSLVKCKPELLSVTISTTNQELFWFAESVSNRLMKRNHFIFSCANSGWVMEATDHERQITASFCNIACRLINAEASLVTAVYTKDYVVYEKICQELKELASELNLFEKQENSYHCVMYSMLRQYTDALYPDCPDDFMRDYHEFYALYQNLHNGYTFRSAQFYRIGLNPYQYFHMNHALLSERRGQKKSEFVLLDRAQTKPLRVAMQSILEAMPAFSDKVAALRSNAYMSRLLLAAASALVFRGLAVGPDCQVEEADVKFFVNHMRSFEKNKGGKGSCFDMALFSGWITLLEYYENNNQTEKTDSVFRVIMDILLSSSNRLFQQHGLTTLNMIVVRTMIKEHDIYDLTGKAAFVQELSEHIENMSKSYCVGVAAQTARNETRWRENFIYQLAASFYQLYNHIHEVLCSSKDVQTNDMQLVNEELIKSAVAKYYSPVNRASSRQNRVSVSARIKDLIKMVERVLTCFGNQDLKEHLITSNDLIAKSNGMLAVMLDYYVSLAEVTAHNRYLILLMRYTTYSCHDLLLGTINMLTTTKHGCATNVYCEEFNLLMRLYELLEKILEKILLYAEIYGFAKKNVLYGNFILPEHIVYSIFKSYQNDASILNDGDGDVSKAVTHVSKSLENVRQRLQIMRGLFDAANKQSQQTANELLAEESAYQRLKKMLNAKSVTNPKLRLKKWESDSDSGDDPVNESVDFPENQDEVATPFVEEGIGSKLRSLNAELATLAGDQHLELAILQAKIASLYQQKLEMVAKDDDESLKDNYTQAQSHYNAALVECSQDDSDLARTVAYFVELESANIGMCLSPPAHTLISQAEALCRRNEFAEALEVYSKVNAIGADLESVVLGKARCYSQMGQLDKAVDILLPYQAQNTSAYRVKLALATIYTQQRQMSKAAPLYDELRGSQLAGFNKSYFKFLYNTHRHDELNYCLEQLINSKLINRPSNILLVAKYAWRLGRYQWAKKYYQKLRIIAPSDHEYQTACAAFFGLSLHRQKEIDCLDKIIEERPFYISAYVEKAKLLALDGKKERAIQVMDNILRKYSSLVWLHITKVHILLDCGEHQKLNLFLNYLVTKFPNNWECLYHYYRYHTQPNSSIINNFKRLESPEQKSKAIETAKAGADAVEVANPCYVLTSIRNHVLTGGGYTDCKATELKIQAAALKQAGDVSSEYIVAELRLAAESRCFKKIIEDWNRLGILLVLFPIPQMATIPQKTIVSILSDCEKLPPTHDKALSFIKRVLWCLVKEVRPLSTAITRELVNGNKVPFLNGLSQNERDEIISALDDLVIANLKSDNMASELSKHTLFAEAKAKRNNKKVDHQVSRGCRL